MPPLLRVDAKFCLSCHVKFEANPENHRLLMTKTSPCPLSKSFYFSSLKGTSFHATCILSNIKFMSAF